MLTKSELELVISVIKLSEKLGLLPFCWDKKSFSLKVTNSILKTAIVVSVSIANIFYLIFLIYQIPVTFTNTRTRSGLDDILYHSIGIVASIGATLFKWSLWSSKHELMALVNKTIQLNFRIGQIYYGKQYLDPCRREKYFQAAASAIGICCILFCVATIYNMEKAFNLHALVPVKWRSCLSTIIICFAEIVFKVDLLLPIAFIFVTCFLYLFSITFWLSKICVEWPIITQVTRRPCLTRCIKIYRSLHILNTISTRVYGKIIIPFYKVLFVVAVAVLIFGGIRFSKVLDTFSAAFLILTVLNWPIEMILTLNVMAGLSQYSNQLVPNLERLFIRKQRIVQKYYTQHLNSCQPIRFQLGSLYPMRRNASLRIADYVVNMASYLLVTIN